jgi:RNA polymerase sigma-70 factor (ECF subfamily)
MPSTDCTVEFVSLFATHDRGIYKYILTLMVDPDAAQEVFQEASITLWQKFSEFRPGSNFFAWACRVAYFEVLKYRQTHRRDRLRFNDDLLETIAEERSASEGLLQARRRALTGCLQKLSPRDRTLIEHRYAGPHTVLEIAQQTGRPVNTLYKGLERIRRTLMHCIDKALAMAQ